VSSLEDFPTKVPSLPDLQAVRELAWALSGLGRRRTFGVPRTCAVHDCPVQMGVGGQAVVYHRNVGGGPRNPSRSRSGLWTLIEAFPRSLRFRFRKARAAMISMGAGFRPGHHTSDVHFVTAYPMNFNHKYYYPRTLLSASLSCSRSRPQDCTSGWRKNGRLLSKNG